MFSYLLTPLEFLLTKHDSALDHNITPTPAPTQKDEFLAKIYAFSTLDKTTATGLLFTREQQLNKIMQKNQKKLNDLSLDKRQEFGRYVVIQRRIMLCQQELQWCQQVRELAVQ